MKRIISVSRRTDIPAFYVEWFMNRLKAGFAGYVNPFGGQKYLVSLKPEDVIAFVLWSKNYSPFIEYLRIIESMGYKFYFNYTITGLPNIFECNLVETEIAIEALKEMSRMYSPKHISWRYDPIIISDVTDYAFHVQHFEEMASSLEGHVERCYFSYAIQYGKVQRNFEKFQKQQRVRIDDPSLEMKLQLAGELADIASQHGIKMMTCCGDYLIGSNIVKAHCVDGEIIKELFYKSGISYSEKPTRKECGCTVSTDIGTYDTCPHGCIYCYANVNKDVATKRFNNHDSNSAFLGYSKGESDRWVTDLQDKKKEKVKVDQMGLF